MENFGKFTFIILSLILLPLLNGFIVSKLYLWFIVPTFNMEPLRIVEAIGLSLIVKYMTTITKRSDSETTFKDLVQDNLFQVIMALLILTIAWIVNLFI